MAVQISYFHTSECVPAVLPVAEGGPDAAVVIDVLRATTTIAWSLENGAEAIQAFADLAELDRMAAAWPEERRLRAGERGGKRVEGYDLGNSPLAVTPERTLADVARATADHAVFRLDADAATALLVQCTGVSVGDAVVASWVLG